jgi:hypothetical protein
METELEQILKLIEGIKDNGNNTAVKVREVLTAMANYSGSNEGFEIATEDLVINDNQMYHYSFKGIKKQCCNAFLMLSNIKGIDPTNGNGTESNNFMFMIDAEQYAIMKDFIPDFQRDRILLTYVAPTYGKEAERWLSVGMYRPSDKLAAILVATNLEVGEGLITTIALNFKPFKMPETDTKEGATRFTAAAMKADTSKFSSFKFNMKAEDIKK